MGYFATSGLVLAVLLLGQPTEGAAPIPTLPDFDHRPQRGQGSALTEAQTAAKARLEALVPEARVEVDALLGTPKWIASPHATLSGPGGAGRAMPRRPAPPAGAADPDQVT
jgi:hypothetical protein